MTAKLLQQAYAAVHGLESSPAVKSALGNSGTFDPDGLSVTAKKLAMPDYGYSQFTDREQQLQQVRFQQSGSGPEFWFTALCEEKGFDLPIGEITCSRFDPDGEDEEEHDSSMDFAVEAISIDKSWRGTGLGQTLYEKAIEFALAQGAERFYSDETRTPDADRAWKRLGQRWPVVNVSGRFCVDLFRVRQRRIGRRPGALCGTALDKRFSREHR